MDVHGPSITCNGDWLADRKQGWPDSNPTLRTGLELLNEFSQDVRVHSDQAVDCGPLTQEQANQVLDKGQDRLMMLQDREVTTLNVEGKAVWGYRLPATGFGSFVSPLDEFLCGGMYAVRMSMLRSLGLFGVLLCSYAALAQGALIPEQHFAVQGAPFLLTVSMATDDGNGPTQNSTQQILRDREGRQRYDPIIAGGQVVATYTRIDDVLVGRRIVLHSTEKTAEVAKIPAGQAVVMDPSIASSYAPLQLRPGQTLLGFRTICGLEAWGLRTVGSVTLEDGTAGTREDEIWVSSHYRIRLEWTFRLGKQTRTQVVSSSSAADPDPALFVVPPGYAVHDAPPPGFERVGNGVSAPMVIKQVNPEYSAEARRKKIKGDVLVSLMVDENGVPQQVQVKRGIGQGLDEKAIEARKQYRFRPAMRAGVPVKVQLLIDVNFQIF